MLEKRKNVFNQSLVADQMILKGTANASNWIKGIVSNMSTFLQWRLLTDWGVGWKCGIGIVNHYLAECKLAKATKGSIACEGNQTHHARTGAHQYQRRSFVSAKNKTEAIRLIEYLASPREVMP